MNSECPCKDLVKCQSVALHFRVSENVHLALSQLKHIIRYLTETSDHHIACATQPDYKESSCERECTNKHMLHQCSVTVIITQHFVLIMLIVHISALP